MKRLTLFHLLLLVAVLAPLKPAWAEENLGHLELSGLFLQPFYRHQEPRTGSFSLGSSYAELRWTLDSIISAQVKFGSQDLIGRPARFGPVAGSESLAVIEAFAQADAGLGRVRLGMIPVPFGLEGGDAEKRLLFPRSLVFQERYLVLRDVGVSYHVSSAGFFSDWTIHNGEAGADLENELWFTARLGWESGRGFSAGISGSTGRTSPRATNPTGAAPSPGAWFDPDQGARFRIVNAFVSWMQRPFRVELEGLGGEAIQGESVIKTRALHADLIWLTPGSVDALVRYEILDPRNDQGGDQLAEYSVGLAWHSRYYNSVLTVLGTKRARQDVPVDEHRAVVMWRITPFTDKE